MPCEEWIKTLKDGRKVKFIYQELPKDGAFIIQLAGNEVVYSVVLTDAGNPLSREDVENYFEDELSQSNNTHRKRIGFHGIPVLRNCRQTRKIRVAKQKVHKTTTITRAKAACSNSNPTRTVEGIEPSEDQSR